MPAYLRNGNLLYMPEELEIALKDRRLMLEAGCRTLRDPRQFDFFGTQAHVRDEEGTSLTPEEEYS